jgi:hypothetical protein
MTDFVASDAKKARKPCTCASSSVGKVENFQPQDARPNRARRIRTQLNVNAALAGRMRRNDRRTHETQDATGLKVIVNANLRLGSARSVVVIVKSPEYVKNLGGRT